MILDRMMGSTPAQIRRRMPELEQERLRALEERAEQEPVEDPRA